MEFFFSLVLSLYWICFYLVGMTDRYDWWSYGLKRRYTKPSRRATRTFLAADHDTMKHTMNDIMTRSFTRLSCLHAFDDHGPQMYDFFLLLTWLLLSLSRSSPWSFLLLLFLLFFQLWTATRTAQLNGRFEVGPWTPCLTTCSFVLCRCIQAE